MKISSKYFRLSLYYFFYFTTISTYAPYLGLYLSFRGLSYTEVGLALAVPPFIGLFAQPVWGMIVDHYQNERWLVPSWIGLSALALLLFQHLSGLDWLLPGLAVFALMQTGTVPVVDSLTIRVTGIENFGKVRLFGSLGWALAALPTAFIYHKFGITMLPYTYFVAVILALIGWSIYPKMISSKRYRNRSHHTNNRLALKRLLHNKRFLLVLLATTLVTTSQSINGNFFAIYYHDLGHPMNLLGGIYSLGALCELPFMFFVGRLLNRFGPGRVFLIGATVFALRWVTLSLSPPTYILLLAQLTHGISFGFTFPAGVAIAAGVSEEVTRATAQAIYSAFNTGISFIIGSIFGGIALTSFGPLALYREATGLALIGILAMVFMLRRWGELVASENDQSMN